MNNKSCPDLPGDYDPGCELYVRGDRNYNSHFGIRGLFRTPVHCISLLYRKRRIGIGSYKFYNEPDFNDLVPGYTMLEVPNYGRDPLTFHFKGPGQDHLAFNRYKNSPGGYDGYIHVGAGVGKFILHHPSPGSNVQAGLKLEYSHDSAYDPIVAEYSADYRDNHDLKVGINVFEFLEQIEITFRTGKSWQKFDYTV